MLLTISIQHFLTIDALELDFEAGLTVFTGESGAGKSILIEALLLALGHKVSVDVIRPGQDQAEIVAKFEILSGSPCEQWLLEQEFMHEEELIIRRLLHRSGRSKAYVNGKLCSVQQLKVLGEHLVHIHGQHAQQHLLQGQVARLQLDKYVGHRDLLQSVEDDYRRYQDRLKQSQALASPEALAQQLSFLSFQRDELVQLALQPGETESLYREHKRLHHVKEYLQSGARVIQLLEDETGVCRQLALIQQTLRHLPEEEKQVQQIKALIDEAVIQCDEALQEGQNWIDSLTMDPERIQAVESRMSQLHQMARKYRVEVEALPKLLEQLSQQCHEIETALASIPATEEQLVQARQRYENQAIQLRESRMGNAQPLAQALTQVIQQLGMAQGEIKFEFHALEQPSLHGLDRVEYLVKTNLGMSFQPLAKVLSGGELSRVSLAVELMTSERQSIPTLIFDEVDVGISGKTAAVVGRLMRQLGEKRQVFCVTHQPQVAAFAHHHYRVRKCLEESSSNTQVMGLAMQERMQELATMLGGMKQSEDAVRHARHLLEEAQG